MTAPAPSPDCSQEAHVATPVKKRRGMVAFYVATGVACLLLVGFYFAWTPLRVWYWEREVHHRESSRLKRTPSGVVINRATISDAARELVRIGPRAAHALKRLLQEEGENHLRLDVLDGIRGEDVPWVAPLLVGLLRTSQHSEARVTVQIMEQCSGRQFMPPPARGRIENLAGSTWGKDERVEEGRKNALVWWEKEGKAKYGRSDR